MLLDDQDRARWDHDLIATALARLDASPLRWVMGPYRAQAEIARAHIVAHHARARPTGPASCASTAP